MVGMSSIGTSNRHYGGKSANLDVQFNGPIFNPLAARHAMQAANREIEALAKLGADAARAVLTPGHGVRSGAFRDSIGAEMKKDLLAVVRSTDKRPIRTFLETGVRRHAKARAITRGKNAGQMTNRYRAKGTRGYYMFRAGRAAVAAQDPAARIGRAVAAALGGGGSGWGIDV